MLQTESKGDGRLRCARESSQEKVTGDLDKKKVWWNRQGGKMIGVSL